MDGVGNSSREVANGELFIKGTKMKVKKLKYKLHINISIIL